MDSFLDKRWHKPLFILTFFGLIILLFLIYKNSIYRWSCKEESNSASCYFVGKSSLQNGRLDEAREYFNKSCNLNYGLGCWELHIMYKMDNKTEESLRFKEKACSLDVKELCAMK